MAEVREGGCLCGAVRYRVRGEPKISAVCHCNVCKRRTGSAFGMSAYFDEADVEVTSGALKTHQFHSLKVVVGQKWSSAQPVEP